MKRLLSFLFVMFMVSPSLSQIQNVAGVWVMEKSGMDDSTKYECRALIKLEEGGKFHYAHSFKIGDSQYIKKRTGEWKMTDTHKITLIVRFQQTNDYTVLFRKLDFLTFFILRGEDKTSAIFYDEFFTIPFEKVSDDFDFTENDKSPQKVLAKKKSILI